MLGIKAFVFMPKQKRFVSETTKNDKGTKK
jgi:hypothetical protein